MKLFTATVKLAHTSPYGRFRVGAIIAHRNSVVSMGVNQKKSHPLQARFSSRPHLKHCWLHAEIHAITLANTADILGADCYVARVLMDGQLGASRPCKGCSEALKHYGLNRMIYWCDGEIISENI